MSLSFCYLLFSKLLLSNVCTGVRLSLIGFFKQLKFLSLSLFHSIGVMKSFTAIINNILKEESAVCTLPHIIPTIVDGILLGDFMYSVDLHKFAFFDV